MEDEKKYLVKLYIKATIFCLEGNSDLYDGAVQPSLIGAPLSLLIPLHLEYESSFILSYSLL